MTPYTWHVPIDIASDQLQNVTGLPRLSFFLIELNFIEAAFEKKFEVDNLYSTLNTAFPELIKGISASHSLY
nr:hypothetical protein [Aquicella siphonis]